MVQAICTAADRRFYWAIFDLTGLNSAPGLLDSGEKKCPFPSAQAK